MTNKKRAGFTTVELVIVIAVIAILASVLIPTFTGIIDKANESAALQEVQSAYINALAEALGTDLENKTVPIGDYNITFTDSTGQNATISGSAEFNSKYPNAAVVNGVVVLSPASGGENTEDEEDGGGTGGPVTTVDALITALAAGGEVTLGDDIVLNEAVTIDKETTINLNGNTLTLGTGEENQEWVSSPITVSGTLTITGSGNSAVEIATYDYSNAGIHVQSGGTLNLTDIAVNDNLAMKGIKNEGSAMFTNVKFNVENGIGLYNTGAVVISGCEFIANGSIDGLIYNGESSQANGGTMTITNTQFTEVGSSSSYSTAQIYLYNGNNVTLTNVTAATSTYSIYTVGYNTITINGGNYGGQFLCIGSDNTIITIGNGTKFNDTAIENISDKTTIYLGGSFGISEGENCWIIAPKS